MDFQMRTVALEVEKEGKFNFFPMSSVKIRTEDC